MNRGRFTSHVAFNVDNPIMREIERLAAKGRIVKGIHALDPMPDRFGVEFRLADGTRAAFHVDGISNSIFHQWFMEAFRLILSRHPFQWGICGKTAARREGNQR